MKFSVPEISWHNRDPVLSVDFQPRKTNINEPIRLATGGTDTHVLIWHVSISENSTVTFDIVTDIARHQKAVNVVRWSPSGEYLASGDDESIIFVWKQRTDLDPPPIFDQTNEQDRETWIVHKTLRGHMEDVYDISWHISSSKLASGSVDNTVMCWDLNKARSYAIFTDHKGFVQGVSWDPLSVYIASISSDRTFRVFDAKTKKVISRSSKAILPVPENHPLHNINVRLYYDDTLQTYFRRLHFSPDGMLIAVPSGYIESEQNRQIKPIYAVHVYTRYSLKIPACILPCGDSPALAVRWAPVVYKLRTNGPRAAFPIGDGRMILAVATKTSVVIYDTQQKTPVALVSNIHYTRLTDLTWSSDGKILIASSTDGFCSVITFNDGELGEVIEKQIEFESIEKMEIDNDIEDESPKPINVKFKTPKDKNKEVLNLDLIEEVAMSSWSEDSNSELKNKKQSVLLNDDTEDIKLVYDESEHKSKVEEKKSDNKVSPQKPTQTDSILKPTPSVPGNPTTPKAPRRVSFVTLSSPKNPKKKS